MARVDGELVAIFDHPDHLVDVREVELRVDALRVHVERDGDEAGVAGAFAIAEQTALDAVGAGEQAEFGRRDAGATIIVGVQRNQRSEEHTSELQSLMRISYAVFCLKKKTSDRQTHKINTQTTN